MKFDFLRAVPLAFVIAIATACGDDPSAPPSVAAVQVAATADSVAVGETLQLSASIKDRGGDDLTGRAVEWSSDNPGVARVDAGGAITAVSMGTATISARSEGQAGSVRIRVVAVAVKKVELNVPDRPALIAGQTLQLVATAFNAAGKPITGRPIAWATGDTMLATVTPNGLVTIVRAGQVRVSATIGGVAAALTIEIYSMGVSVWPDTTSLLPGGSQKLEARAYTAKGEPVALRGAAWESSDPAVARVDSTGQVTGVGNGRATITAVLGRERVVSQISVFSYPRPLRFTTVTTGDNHACGLTAEGDAYCWGASRWNQLTTRELTSRCESIIANGDGFAYRTVFRCSAIPLPVAGGLRFASIVAGEQHTCGLNSAGTAYCWGSLTATAPVAVSSEITFRSLSGGMWFVCGISTSNEAYCWGDGRRLGNGSVNPSSVPAKVAGGLLFATLSSGYTHTCGITLDGDTYCWGIDVFGELGTGTIAPFSTVPQRVVGNARFTSVSAGLYRTCALTAAGRAYCWGDAAGVLDPRGARQPSPVPYPVPGNVTFASLIVERRPCGLTADGRRYCWETGSTPPTLAAPAFPVRRYASGAVADCFISMDGVTYCMGMRNHGQTGAGVFDNRTSDITPVAGQ